MSAAYFYGALAKGDARVGIGEGHHACEPRQRIDLRYFESPLFRQCDHLAVRFGRAIQVAHGVACVTDALADFDLQIARPFSGDTRKQSQSVFENRRRVAMRVAACGILRAQNQVARRALELAALLEVQSQFGG